MIIDKIKNIFTKEDNNLYCYTSTNSVYEFGDIDTANKSVPSWWKKLKVSYPQYQDYYQVKPFNFDIFPNAKRDVTTIKHCPAMVSKVNTGFIIKAWCDIKIFVHPDGIVNSAMADEKISYTGQPHHYIQRAGFLPNMAHWKIHSPWFFKTKNYRKFFWTGAYFWNQSLVEQNIYVMEGFIDYYTQSGTEINMFFPIKDEVYTIDIKKDDALAYIFPIDDKPIKVVKKLVSEQEMANMSNAHVTFFNNPKVLRSKIKN
jgi:hypothetical protein